MKVEKANKDVKFMFDVKHRPNSLVEENFWKALDFKIIFIALVP